MDDFIAQIVESIDMRLDLARSIIPELPARQQRLWSALVEDLAEHTAVIRETVGRASPAKVWHDVPPADFAVPQGVDTTDTPS